MKNKELQPSVPFWEPRINEDGSTVIRVPGDTIIEPVFGKYRHIKKWGSYVTNDPRFGENSVVFIFYDSERQETVKEIIMGLPPDIVSAMTAYDHKDLGLQRKDEENRDFRSQDSGRDEAGDYHLGGFDQAAYEAYIREENQSDEEKTYEDDALIGAQSEDFRIRNAQIRYMAEVIRKALHRLPEKNRMVYIRLFGQCIHNPATIVAGDHTEMEKAIALLETVKDSIINAYEIKTGLPREEISRMMEEETWMPISSLSQ